MKEKEIIKILRTARPILYPKFLREKLFKTDDDQKIIRILTKLYFHEETDDNIKILIIQLINGLGGDDAVQRLETLKKLGRV